MPNNFGITPGAGVDGLIQLGKSQGMVNNMSGLSKGVVWSSSLAMSQLAHGNQSAAVGIAAGTILAATAYYTASAISQGFASAAATTAINAASAVTEIIPIIGPVISGIIDVVSNLGVKPGGGNAAIWANECIKSVFTTKVGSGPQNQILPADLFMGPTENDFGQQHPDVFKISKFMGGKDVPTESNWSQLAELLIELENPAPDNAFAKIVWPNVGLSSEVRQVLRKLRRGISSLYINPLTGQKWTPKIESDGGSTLWVPYIDLLNHEWRAGRINLGWLIWREQMLEDKFSYPKGNGPADHYLTMLFTHSGMAPQEASALAYRLYTSASTDIPGQSACALYDTRAARKIELMVDGWQKLIASPYSQFKDEFANSWQAGNNPLHGPSGSAKGIGISAPVLGALAVAGGIYYYQPALISKAWDFIVSLPKRLY